jgi:hypothetical protein
MTVCITHVTTDPPQFVAEFKDDERFDHTVVLTIGLDQNERSRLQQLLVKTDGHDQVTALDIRAIPVRELVREATLEWLGHGTETELHVAAEAHKRATKAGDDALLAVAQALGVGRSTAANRVREARLAGLLPERRLIRRRPLKDQPDTKNVAKRVAKLPRQARTPRHVPGQSK